MSLGWMRCSSETSSLDNVTGYEIGLRNIPVAGGRLLLDLNHRGSEKSDGYYADVEGLVKIPFGDDSINLGVYKKFRNGYLFGGEYIDGAALILGYSISSI